MSEQNTSRKRKRAKLDRQHTCVLPISFDRQHTRVLPISFDRSTLKTLQISMNSVLKEQLPGFPSELCALISESLAPRPLRWRADVRHPTDWLMSNDNKTVQRTNPGNWMAALGNQSVGESTYSWNIKLCIPPNSQEISSSSGRYFFVGVVDPRPLLDNDGPSDVFRDNLKSLCVGVEEYFDAMIFTKYTIPSEFSKTNMHDHANPNPSKCPPILLNDLTTKGLVIVVDIKRTQISVFLEGHPTIVTIRHTSVSPDKFKNWVPYIGVRETLINSPSVTTSYTISAL